MEETSTTEQARLQAKEAGLRYTTDTKPGIYREKHGDHFVYIRADGEPVTDETTLARIRKLAIPPAYEQVWISTQANGHLQATGRDARGRKQYRYHTQWRQVRDEDKFYRMLSFGRDLPAIRAAVNKDLGLKGMPKEKVLATIVRLLETTLIRVGNEEYARSNKSFGLTTFKNKHVKVQGAHIRFVFKGKSHVAHDIDLQDRHLAGIVSRLRDIPGQDLFQYEDAEGVTHPIGSDDVNSYLSTIAQGQHYTAKDFRTWAGTLLACKCLVGYQHQTQAEAHKNMLEAIKSVSQRLGNTPAVCRKSYIHPAVLEAYVDGSLAALADSFSGKATDHSHEGVLIEFLKKRLALEQEGATA